MFELERILGHLLLVELVLVLVRRRLGRVVRREALSVTQEHMLLLDCARCVRRLLHVLGQRLAATK